MFLRNACKIDIFYVNSGFFDASLKNWDRHCRWCRGQIWGMQRSLGARALSIFWFLSLWPSTSSRRDPARGRHIKPGGPQPSVPRWCFYYNLENLKFGSVFLKGNEGTIWPLWFSWLLMVYYLCRPCGVDRSSGMLNSQYDTTVQCTEYMPPLDSVQWLWCPSKGQTSDWKDKGAAPSIGT